MYLPSHFSPTPSPNGPPPLTLFTVMDWKLCVLTSVLVYCTGTVFFHHGIKTAASRVCGHGALEKESGRCVCEARYVGRTCQLCEMGLWGAGCWAGSSEGSDSSEPIRVAFLTSPVDVTQTHRRVTQTRQALSALPDIDHVHVFQWNGAPTVRRLLKAKINYVIALHYASDMPSAFHSFREESTESSVRIVAWVLQADVEVFLWQELQLDAYISPSETFLKQIAAAPNGALVMSVPEPALGCEIDDTQMTQNVTFFGDFSDENKEVVEELQGFGVSVVGSGWGGKVGGGVVVKGRAFAGEVVSRYAGSRICIIASEARRFADVPAVEAFDASLCGCSPLPSPRQEQRPLRHAVPLGIFPQDIFDLRVLIAQLLSSDTEKVHTLRKHYTTAARHQMNHHTAAEQILKAYKVLR